MQDELSKCLIGAAAFTSPIWISCLIGAICWAWKHLTIGVRSHLDALADAEE